MDVLVAREEALEDGYGRSVYFGLLEVVSWEEKALGGCKGGDFENK